jgi:pyruvate kinase
LNLAWGVRPLLVDQLAETMDGMFRQVEQCLVNADLAAPGDKVLIVGGLPMKQAGSTNFLKIHTVE